MSVQLPVEFDDSYARAVPTLSVPWRAAEFPAPKLIQLNEELADELGIAAQALREPAGVALLVGRVPAEHKTYAQAYAGHQFGSYSPRLGDGRALLLGEVIDRHGRRRDLHLKGSGRTPFARGGDGKAVVGPMLREYLIGEAMYALGIPTTRALSVVTTGEQVFRSGPQPGAVLCRVAASHLRVGSFQYAAATGDEQLLTSLADYAIARHYPQAAESDNRYLEFFAEVARAQARLIADWVRVGFVHGVMNTDNMAISGESIDFGPCAFMDAYDPGTVFSSIDHGGRYAYGNQPALAQWNLTRLGEALLPLIDERQEAAVEQATAVLEQFGEDYYRFSDQAMAAKLGLTAPDQELFSDLLAILKDEAVDFTGFFRALAGGTAGELVSDRNRFEAWSTRWEHAVGPDRAAVADRMNRVNPLYIPRNHRVEEALAAASAGVLGPFERLLDAIRDPFTPRPGLEDLTTPAPGGGRDYVTYCGT